MENNSKKPSIVVVSNSNTKPKSLIKLITKKTPQEIDDNIVIQPWCLQTKYYTAEVDLVGIISDYDRNDEFNERVEGLLVVFDSNNDKGLSDLQIWEKLENSCSPEVKLLITNYCDESTKITRGMAIEWCLKRGYEFIELYPKLEDVEDEQDIIPEKVGVDRVIEALHAHVWPNLVMNDDKKDTQIPNGRLNMGDELEDDFSELFNQLHVMKESIKFMPARDKRQCAEQIVKAFWNAMGGDDEELGDL